MRRWLLDPHLYLGLLCLPYLVVFGVSSIALNHDIQRETTSAWSAQIAPLAEDALPLQATATLGALELRANVLPHTLVRGEAGTLAFRAIRPGRSYQVSVTPGGAVRVREADSGVLGIVRALHGASDRQSSLWSFGWALYTELATAVLLFSIASGVLLMLPRASGRALGFGAGALGLAACVALATAIW